ncbi:MAG: Gfo/Idh/MocA family oxidoreductase [Planctomycetes bacterium]|jgi:predicted dehydrogenase|nr:Gfo/Idh/MocA family oxidoreductase [Planctomycetota bacterium]HPY75754.1 Gfo/Idh/MocA family oxidoreductase [Planctomycetota bacterium]HQB01287.1 Gfo/Idh/MocA family oxidoreductase [Planctomycetota bacterium]
MKVAVVGVGHLGKIHARIYHQLPNVDLVAVVDVDKNKATEVATLYETVGITDYKELFGKVDAVSVASFTKTHHAIVKDFLEQGIHVLVEKPLAATVEEATELVETAKKHNCTLQVGHVERFNPVVEAMMAKNIVPKFIQAERCSPFRFRSGDIGVVLDMMIHDIDIVRAMAKSKVVDVEAYGTNFLGQHEDIVQARLKFDSGCIAVLLASRIALEPSRKIKVFAENYYMDINYATGEGKCFQVPSKEKLLEWNLQAGIPKGCEGQTFESIFYGKILKEEPFNVIKHEPLYEELNSFIQAIEQKKRPLVDGEDGLEVVKIAHWIMKELRK